jgi:Domain of unknown function (DUF5753)/Helix-turn-helix domain
MSGAGSVVVRRQLGAKLRGLRIKAGKEVADVVEAGIASKAKIHKIEAGKGMVKLVDVWALCRLYNADSATTDALAALAPGTQQEDWWEAWGTVVVPDWLGLYVGLEQSAARLQCWDPELVHGLLQIEDYARAVIGAGAFLAPDVVDQRVGFRMDRQRRVLGSGPDLTVVLGAGALSRVVGSPDVMAAQLDHLRRLDRDGLATVRVLPWSAGAYPTRGSFALLHFPDPEDPTVAYLEFSMGARYVEQPAQVSEYEKVFDIINGQSIGIEEWAE